MHTAGGGKAGRRGAGAQGPSASQVSLPRSTHVVTRQLLKALDHSATTE